MTDMIIVRNDGERIERHGTSGLTLISQRNGDAAEILIEHDYASPKETIAMIGVLLASLEEHFSENFVVQCFRHYAEETGKVSVKVGQDHLVYHIYGRKDRPLTRRKKTDE